MKQLLLRALGEARWRRYHTFEASHRMLSLLGVPELLEPYLKLLQDRDSNHYHVRVSHDLFLQTLVAPDLLVSGRHTPNANLALAGSTKRLQLNVPWHANLYDLTTERYEQTRHGIQLWINETRGVSN